MKEVWNWQRDGSNTSTGFIVWEGALWRWISARELESTAAYRLGVDIGERSGGETPLGGKILLEWGQPSLGEVRGEKW
jgi:hypothetical protein